MGVVVVAAFAPTAARVARGGDGGALDVELSNRASVNGAISAANELDTHRLRVLESAELRVTVRGVGRVTPAVRVFGPGDTEVGANLVRRGRTVKLARFTAAGEGLYRIDVRAEGAATGTYRLDASWRLKSRESFSGDTGPAGAFYVFDAEAGTRINVALRALGTGGTVRAVRVTGPQGFALDFLEPRASAKHRVKTPPLPATGRYQVDILADAAGRTISGTLARRAPAAKARFDLRGAERRGAGVARRVSRIVGGDGGGLEVPRLEERQRVSIDASGVCLSVPSGAVPFPAVFELRTDDDAIDDPLGFAPAGVSVNFNSGGATLEKAVEVALPYDVGAFLPGDVLSEICVLRRTEDGEVFEISRPSMTVDVDDGIVSFPTSGFSSFQVFSPPVEIAVVAEVGQPNDLAPDPDGSALYVTTDILSSNLPASAVMRYVPGGSFERYAGGGDQTGDAVDRLDYDFDHDLGFSAVLLAAIAVDGAGNVLVVTGDLARTTSVAYIVLTDGRVVRVAGDGTPFLDETLPARETGLPFCCAATFLSDGNALLVTDTFIYPESDRVLAVTADGPTLDDLHITTVAGGGTSDVSGSHPLLTRLLQPRAVLVDSQGRILVGDRDWLIRFDLDAGTTTTLAGTNFGLEDESGGTGRTIGGIGAPLRTVVLGALDDLAFAPGREDILYAADPEAGIVWRFDLQRDRAFVAAGRRVGFGQSITTREPDPDNADPGAILNFPSAVAPLGAEVFIAERFDDRLFTLRRRAQ